LSLSSSWSSQSGAHDGFPVRCDISHLMSLSIGMPARVGRFVALISISWVTFRLLLICVVELALSMLAAAGSCCLQVRRVHRPCRGVQSFPSAWTARRAATSWSMGEGHRVMTGLRDCRVGSSLFYSAIGFTAWQLFILNTTWRCALSIRCDKTVSASFSLNRQASCQQCSTCACTVMQARDEHDPT
jgi:hypothetical protein